MAEELSLSEQVDLIVRPFVGADEQADPSLLLGGPYPIIDVGKPNYHNSKSEFREEQEYVARALEMSDNLFEMLKSGIIDPTEPANTVTRFVDWKCRNQPDEKRPTIPVDLVLENSISSGLSLSLAVVLLEFRTAIMHRRTDLLDQEKEFWSGSSRPPNHYARTIALRIARAYARRRNLKPTYGTARDGGHPSTDFGRVLEQVYEILGIRAKVAGQAKWAIDQLTEEDLMPSRPGPFANILKGVQTSTDGSGGINYLNRMLQKDLKS